MCAANVELRIWGSFVCLVQRQELRANEIVTCRKILGDDGGDVPIVGDELFGAPLISCAVIAIFHDLEPSIASCVVGGCRIRNLFHVHCTGALVTGVNRPWLLSIGPGAPFEGQHGACIGAGNSGYTCLAIDTWRGDLVFILLLFSGVDSSPK